MRMLGRRKKEDLPMFVAIQVDGTSYKRFQDFANSHHLGEAEALRLILVKGMESFQSQQLAEMVEEYELLKKPYEEYKRDHERLARLLAQNRELAELLKTTDKGNGNAIPGLETH